jgi:hypothetical protein
MSQPKLTPTVTDQLMAGGPTPALGQGVRFITPPTGDPLKPHKVAIVGTQPSSRMLAPWGDPTWTIWGTSPGNMGMMPRVDAWFEMHANFLWPQYAKAYGEQYVKWLNEQTFPIVAQDQKLIKKAIAYPLFDMIRKFGPYFFTSTFAYAMAYAVAVGAEEIGMYGVDMSSRGEYIVQRPGGYYFIQRAREAGIKVTIPQESDLEQPPPLYGYSDASDFGRKQATRRFEVDERISQLEQQINQGNQQLAYLKGAKEDIQYNEDVYASVEQLAVFKHLLREQAIFKHQMPTIDAPPLVPDSAPVPAMGEPIAGLDLPGVVSNAGVGSIGTLFEDAFPDLRPRIPGKRKVGVGKRKRGRA